MAVSASSREDEDMAVGGYQEIRYEVDGPVLTLILSRPEKLNAFTTRMCQELIDAFDRSDADDSVRVVILTGSGRGFCAGADLSSGASMFTDTGIQGAQDRNDHRDLGGTLVLRILRSLKPVIAAVNGPAVGIGASMTLPADIRLASTAARMGFVFTRRGISPDGCSSWLLPRLVGMPRAQEWMLTGRVFPAGEGLAAGLFSRVLEPEALLDGARQLAIEMATDTSPVAVSATRQLLWGMLSAPDPFVAHRAESRLLAALGSAQDAAEGVQAFIEKRRPHFSMSPSRDLPGIGPDRGEQPEATI
jgi:enoyl-CoA hydratase/carnithine racemase